MVDRLNKSWEEKYWLAKYFVKAMHFFVNIICSLSWYSGVNRQLFVNMYIISWHSGVNKQFCVNM